MDYTRIPCLLRPAPEHLRRAHFDKHRGDTEQWLLRGDVPPYVDLRDSGFLPPVLDQGRLGSCVSNATSNGLRYLMRKEQIPEFQPSRLWFYWYMRMDIMPQQENTAPPDPAIDSGATVHSVCAAINAFHACPEQLWPYDDDVRGRFSQPPDIQAQHWAQRPCDFAFMPLQSNSLEEARRALAGGSPVLIGIQAYQQSFMQSQGGVITLPDQGDQPAGGHCMLLVGYNEAQQVFIAMNSWTTAWGDEGFCYLPYAFLTDPSLSYDWEALCVFNMSTTYEDMEPATASAPTRPPPYTTSGDNRPANAQTASGGYFGGDPPPQQSPSWCCC